MARQPRVEFEGAMHHVMSRGNDGIVVFRDDDDRERFLTLLAEEIARSRWTLHDYCLMSNHYHLSISTPECTLSTGMHRLLARYVQYFNRRHGRRGHLFQERFKSVLVEEETHGIALSRYIALNPVKARMCERPEGWTWSNYAARTALAATPDWLSVAPGQSVRAPMSIRSSAAYRSSSSPESASRTTRDESRRPSPISLAPGDVY